MRPITKNEIARIAESLYRRGGGLIRIAYTMGEYGWKDRLRLIYDDGFGWKSLVIMEGEDYEGAMNKVQKLSELIYRTQHLKERMTKRDMVLVKEAREKDWEDIDIWEAESREGRTELKNIRSWKYHRDEFRNGLN